MTPATPGGPTARAPLDVGTAKVAIVHDWLPLYGGAERVLEQILAVLPQADLFSLIDDVPEGRRGFLLGKTVRTSFVQRLPRGRTKYRYYFPLMALAIEQFDLSAYDLIVSSSYAFAKGVITGPDQLHLCYCHSPMRYGWDLQHQYLREAGLSHGLLSWIVRGMLHYARLWDVRTANGVDAFMTNSRFTARRIAKTYRRDAAVIYPPVDVAAFPLRAQKDDFYLTASRMVPYKRIGLIVEAFRKMPRRRLVVIGDGPELGRIKTLAAPNVEFLGFQEADVLCDHLQRARAFVFAAEEDFGITPVEAQAAGTPVIAYGRGGACETVVPSVTGVWFERQTVGDVCEAVDRFESSRNSFDSALLSQHAARFAPKRFRREFAEFVEARWLEFHR